ncbi:MAG: TetR/AcrR family transcriptional regulator [Proteobacteria bacterium]|nr:TetR/AcrR family transcriptional regulator [Pseudomonadota bacterium]
MSSGSPDTRAAILKEALRLLEERGTDRVRMADVASAAGVSRQAVYLHFGSRAGLLVELVRFVDEIHDLGSLVAKVSAAASGREALDRFVALWADYVRHIQPAAAAVQASRGRDEAVAAAWNERMGVLRSACRDLVAWLERDGDLAPDWSPADAADLLWAFASIRTWEDLVLERRWSTRRYARHLKRALRGAFLRPDAPSPPADRSPS